MGCHFLFQGIFPTQGLNPCLLHCRWIYCQWAIREALSSVYVVNIVYVSCTHILYVYIYYRYTQYTYILYVYIYIICVHACVLSCFSCVWFFAALWTVAHQPSLSVGFSRQKYWSGLVCPPLGNLPEPGIEPKSLTSPTLADRFFTTSATWETHILYVYMYMYIVYILYPLICPWTLRLLSCLGYCLGK